jgi:hypothetical protein
LLDVKQGNGHGHEQAQAKDRLEAPASPHPQMGRRLSTLDSRGLSAAVGASRRNPDQTETYAEWLARNPAPDLQRLVERWDGFSKVPVDAWTQFDQQMARWQERRRAFLQRT